MSKQYFSKCKTLEQLKSEYKKLAFWFHPDRGGDTATMQEINNQYERMFERVKNIHVNVKGETYEQPVDEVPTEFIELINELIKLTDIEIEIIGKFVWIGGNTKPNKDAIKKLGFKFSSNKQMWYKAPKGYHKKSRKQYTMDEIRDEFGVRYRKTTSRKAALNLNRIIGKLNSL